jgi:two-component system NtrC family sensor kinase
MQKQHPFELTLALEATNEVNINEQELQQVLVNLVGNAAHALPASGGVVGISTSDWEDLGVRISVSDNGSGMDEDRRNQIFNPFYSTKRQGEGTGLGLSVSYGLIRRYGGDITVESLPGEGSRFTVWLRSEPLIVDDTEEVAAQVQAAEAQAEQVTLTKAAGPAGP